MLRRREGINDDQPPTATWTRKRENASRPVSVAKTAIIGVALFSRVCSEHMPDPGDIGRAVAISVEAVVADELWRSEHHCGVAACAFEAVVFHAEGNTALIETDQAAVGNGDPVVWV